MEAREHPFERAGGWVMACALALGLLVEASAAIAALATGHGWTTIPIDNLLTGLVRLPRHLGDPAGAFPPPLRRQLPRAAAWYGAAVLLVAALAFVTMRVSVLVVERR